MPFPRKLLNEGEEVVLDLHPHWWVFVKPALYTAVAAVGAIVVSVLGGLDWLLIVFLVATVFGLLWFLVRYAKWITTNFVVTTDRLIDRSGVFSKSGHEIPLERVNDITSKQSVFERMIGAGDLQIQSGGGDVGPQVIPNMKKPFAVQNEIYRQMEAAQARDADRQAGRRELSVPEQLEKLDELRQRGVLSQAEFDAKKAQLLDRM